MNLIEYKDRQHLMAELADLVTGELRHALSARGRAALAVPGGTTPGPMFDRLSMSALDWHNIDVVLTDERWVPETSERSNTRLLRERLLVGAASHANLIPLYLDGETPEDRLHEIELKVDSAMPLTSVVLGMGNDMHTASLFPGADHLKLGLAIDSPLVLAMRAPGAPEPRMTLSARVLSGAAHRHILIQGADKREALQRALTLDPIDAPVAAVLPGATVHWAA